RVGRSDASQGQQGSSDAHIPVPVLAADKVSDLVELTGTVGPDRDLRRSHGASPLGLHGLAPLMIWATVGPVTVSAVSSQEVTMGSSILCLYRSCSLVVV